LAKFIGNGPKHVDEFLHDAKIDLRELFEKIKPISDTTGTADEQIFLVEQIKGKRIHFESDKPTEDALLKLCHKLVHASAWMLNEADNVLHDSALRKAFSVHILLYSWLTVQMLHDISIIE
jgi:hypothetical protein